MQNIFKKFPLFLFFLLPIALAAQKNDVQLIDEFMQAQARFKRFNGNVLVADKGQIIYQKSFGYADYNTKRKLNDSSVFELASVSKQFTAMCIMIFKRKR
jgi:CubicO group peptidase (beta-lactamase class C family)